MLLQNPDQVLCTFEREAKRGCSATASPRRTWLDSAKKVCGIFAANSADCAGFADSSG
jgi:hypothetical protein